MKNINFYDPSLRYRHDWTSAGSALALLAGTAVAVAIVPLWFVHESRRLQETATSVAVTAQSRKDALASLAARYGRYKTDAGLETRLLALQATLAHRRADLNLLEGGALQESGSYSNALLALARQSVDGLWLTGVAMDHGSMTLRGRTFHPDLIAVYVGRLNGESVLRGQTFRELDIRRPEDGSVVAVAAPEVPPAAQPASGAARRLAPYVDFALTGGREGGADVVAAVANGGSAVSPERKP